MKKTLGGDRLGSGKKQKVELHGFERSTHDMSYLWRSTMAPGTLVPFLCEVGLNGDTFDIKLNCDGKTHPTIGPLFGSFKIQLDTFLCPIRLYNSWLHNNKLKIGMNMSQVKLPQIALMAWGTSDDVDIDNSQINPSCLLAYLGIRGIGYISNSPTDNFPRDFNALPYLMYWDIYKNYYSNKMEEIGAYIHSNVLAVDQTIDDIDISGTALPQVGSGSTPILATPSSVITINYTGARPDPAIIKFNTDAGPIWGNTLGTVNDPSAGVIVILFNFAKYGAVTFTNWNYLQPGETPTITPTVTTFDLENIDEMRELILAAAGNTPFVVDNSRNSPYGPPLVSTNGRSPIQQPLEGLAIKTYQSDLFNNWLNTDWIDGTGGITEVTAIDTSGGSFTIDTLNLTKKVYDMLNRIAVSGGTYDDWQDAVYDHVRFIKAETPIYMGGLSKEMAFQEVISNAQAQDNTSNVQPLGTLAGRGVMTGKHKGGNITIKVEEPSYIIGIISITPRLDYSQGNKWDTGLQTMDDLHKPSLDEIGFQELITEQMAWWTTKLNSTTWEQKSAGKQPAWINYMTNVNQVRGNFAIESNEMFMTLNRKYQHDGTGDIQDLTTYIDPVKYNQIFAETKLDAQNFWMQIAVDMTVRRKISAKIMPNL